ncbi:MAG: hypothetical protein IPL99_08370 [Candidatus Competibacteraceae bacterium]|nr:hypothetical protein [Candidatus Competibacteraceae bacterium]
MHGVTLPLRCCISIAAALFISLGFWLIPVSGWGNALKATDLDQIRGQYFTPSQPKNQIRELAWGGQDYYVIRAATLNLFDEDGRSRTQQRLMLLGKAALLNYLKQKSPGVTSANLRYYRVGLIWKEGDYSYGLFYIQKNDVATLGKTKPQPPPPALPTPMVEPSPVNIPSTISPAPSIEPPDPDDGSQLRPLAPKMPEGVIPSADSQTPRLEPPPANTPSTISPAPDSEPLNSDSVRMTLNVEIARLEQHLKIKPDDLPAWETLKELYRQIGDIDNLNRVLEEILKLKGKISDAL